MPEAREIRPEARVYYEKIARLWEEIGNKEVTANWLLFLGEEEKAKRLYREEAEERLVVDEKFDKYRAVMLFEKAGDEQRANELVSELIADCLARGDKYEAAALHKKYGDKDEARRLFLENAKELEKEESSLPEDSKEKGIAQYWARRAYEEAGAEGELRRMAEASIKKVVEITGDQDSPFIAFDAERIGDVESAKRAYRKLAELYEEHAKRVGVLSQSLIIAMRATFYAKAGEMERAKEMLEKAAKAAEESEGNKRQAIVFYAKIKNEREVKRLLQEIIEGPQDKKETAEALLDLWYFDKSGEYLEKAKTLHLERARKMETSFDPKEKEEAIYSYREAAEIVEGKVQPRLAGYWGKM